MNGFTKGRWYALTTGVASTNSDHMICSFSGLNNEQEANGNLIASAKDMYAALTAIVNNSSIQANNPDECEAAEAALAKADGKGE